MKNAFKISAVILLILSISLTHSCKKKDEPNNNSSPTQIKTNDYKLTLYQPPPTITTTQVILQGEAKNKITGSQVFYFGTYINASGKMVPDKLKSTLTRNANKDTAVVQLFDDNGGVFIYKVNSQTNVKDSILSEFEKIDDLNFYFRVWDYDWSIGKGVCLYTSKVTKMTDSLHAVQLYIKSKAGQPLVSNERIDRFVSKFKNDKFDPSFAYVISSKMLRSLRATQDEADDMASEIQTALASTGSAITHALTSTLPKLGAAVLFAGVVVASEPLIIAGAAVVIVTQIGSPIINNIFNGINNNTPPDNTDVTSTTDQSLNEASLNLTDTYDDVGIDVQNNNVVPVTPYSCAVSVTNWYDSNTNYTYWQVNGGTPPYNWSVYINGSYITGGINDFSYNCNPGDNVVVTVTDSKNCNGNGTATCQ